MRPSLSSIFWPTAREEASIVGSERGVNTPDLPSSHEVVRNTALPTLHICLYLLTGILNLEHAQLGPVKCRAELLLGIDFTLSTLLFSTVHHITRIAT